MVKPDQVKWIVQIRLRPRHHHIQLAQVPTRMLIQEYRQEIIKNEAECPILKIRHILLQHPDESLLVKELKPPHTLKLKHELEKWNPGPHRIVDIEIALRSVLLFIYILINYSNKTHFYFLSQTKRKIWYLFK